MHLASIPLALALLGAPVATAAQTPAPAPAVAPTVAPGHAADVASMDAIVAALYASISGDVGQARDWDRFRHLFHPAALMVPTGANAEGVGVARALTPQGYIDRAEATLVSEGFREREIARRVERFGRIAHVFSTYEAHNAASGDQPFMRGINSIQLFDDGSRWWILTVYWQAEDASTPLPAQYLPEPR